MNITVEKSKLYGFVNAIPSKSIAHRVLICSALSDTTSDVKGITDSADITATRNALESLGASFDKIIGNEFEITPIKKCSHDCIINANESGSTLRFMLPICLALGGNYIFKTSGKLSSRPIDELVDVLVQHGATISKTIDGLMVSGRISGGFWRITGGISSQYVSGLLMALPLLKEDSVLEVTDKMVSNQYIELTLEVLERFMIKIKRDGNKFFIEGNQSFSNFERTVIEGDFSNAAPFLVMGAINSDKTGVTVSNLNFNSQQGDKRIIEILSQAGVELVLEKRTPILTGVFDLVGQVITKFGKLVSGAFDQITKKEDKVYIVNGENSSDDNPISRFSKKISAMFKGEPKEDDVADCDRIRVYKSEIKPLNIDVTDIPDIVPYISILLANADGTSKLFGVERLRQKECDRLDAIIKILNDSGIKTEFENDCLTIHGGVMKSACIRDYNDHRMVMTGVICGSLVGKTQVENIEALEKSYPNFLADFKKINGKFELPTDWDRSKKFYNDWNQIIKEY